MDRYGERPRLALSEPIAVSADGQLIENLEIRATGAAPAIAVGRHRDVRIRSCLISHADAPGINAVGSSALIVEDCEIVCTSAPPAGPLATSEAVNIRLDGCRQTALRRIKASRGASGVYAHRCSGVHVAMLEGHDFRGPFPRGQLVQFDKCRDARLEDFSCENDGATSWPEDNINCYACLNPVIRRGFIHGNNAPSGIGVLIENGEGGEGGLIQDVDVVYWANGAFSAADDARSVVFERCRARDGLGPTATSTSAGKTDYRGRPTPSLEAWLGNQDRGVPMSGQEGFFAYNVGRPDIVFRQCSYANLPKAPNLAWDQDRMALAEFEEVDFTPRARLRLVFPWSTDPMSMDQHAGARLGSRIDPSKPEDGVAASKAELRGNLRAAKAEIEALQSGAAAWRVIDGDHRLTPEDFGQLILVDSARDVTITCPKGLPGESGVAHTLKLVRWGPGSVRVQAEDGLRLASPGGRSALPERYAVATLHLLDGETAILEGV